MKRSKIIPLPSELNDFRAICLTLVITQCLECISLSHLRSETNGQTDAFQFAYRAKRGAKDTIAKLPTQVNKYLDTQLAYVCIFAYFTSAFKPVRQIFCEAVQHGCK